ncbi:uncharacterized protein LOC113334921 [Papaver somniferum]|uniref:uncharacterized protein LOC113334921 n=1 Tax=Papaver somniferum TaxID=3469 RepID=UPI000E701500|nr:uncharacterized protein LOC113334921 [Papaver somniferum]
MDNSYVSPVLNIQQLIDDWMENNTNNSFIMKMCIIWNLWKMRNDMVFSQDTRSHQWSPPHIPCVKINVDAAFIPNNGAAGAIARDHNGVFLGCGTCNFDSTSSLLVESLACKLGLELGKRLGLEEFIIEGDATNVTSAVLGEVSQIPWSIRSTILEVRNMASSFINVSFVSFPKNANNVAHVLCQHAMHENVNMWWNADSPPLCILSNLYS